MICPLSRFRLEYVPDLFPHATNCPRRMPSLRGSLLMIGLSEMSNQGLENGKTQ